MDAPHTVIDWDFVDPLGDRCGSPVYDDDILGELLREYDLAEADPDFVALTIGFCQVRPPLAYTLRLRRHAFDGATGEWLGYRQPDGSYRQDEGS